MATAVISFLTDYGLVDEFVGVCTSVIAQLAPEVRVIDISHDIAPHDIRAGSLTLVRAVQYMADGVVLAIVDPGVGTARRLKSQKLTAEWPIILLSSVTRTTLGELDPIGFAAILSKPVKQTELATTMVNVLRGGSSTDRTRPSGDLP